MVVKGDVKLTSKGKTSQAKVGVKVTEGDSITTGADSRAKIVMTDKNVLNISPNSKLEIAIYKNHYQSGVKKVELKVNEGKVRASVQQKYDEEKNTFKIKTPTAVAGVRGTDFSVSFNSRTRSSQVVTFKGVVAVSKNTLTSNMQTHGSVLVRAGESSEVDPSKASPSSPTLLPQNELNNLDIESDVGQIKSENTSASNEVENRPDQQERGSQKQGEPSKINERSEPRDPTSDSTSSNRPRSSSMTSRLDLEAGSAAQLVDSSYAPRAPTNLNPLPVTNNATQQATQNLITETVRNQITNGRTRVKIEINR